MELSVVCLRFCNDIGVSFPHHLQFKLVWPIAHMLYRSNANTIALWNKQSCHSYIKLAEKKWHPSPTRVIWDQNLPRPIKTYKAYLCGLLRVAEIFLWLSGLCTEVAKVLQQEMVRTCSEVYLGSSRLADEPFCTYLIITFPLILWCEEARRGGYAQHRCTCRIPVCVRRMCADCICDCVLGELTWRGGWPSSPVWACSLVVDTSAGCE